MHLMTHMLVMPILLSPLATENHPDFNHLQFSIFCKCVTLCFGYLYNVLSKNSVVTESNKVLLVEVLRSMAEILIWGDQNDSSVFDFFLEKNVLSFFLRIMKQKCGRYVCVQLLQTLNILFENMRHETSLYYLLSNNMVNQIITHRFDFSDEEIMAYYISFLKTLSLKLNTNTIHFYFNETTNDFPLYTEAIKFFNHSESMVRIAVRTLTLNVYRVSVYYPPMLSFIRDKTAAPYFSNFVWFIGNHIVEIDSCLHSDNRTSAQSKLADLVAEHLDHIHYVNDILSLKIDSLNEVLTEQLIKRLFVPRYLCSLFRNSEIQVDAPRISVVIALFLLSQAFFILTHQPLVETLVRLITGETSLLNSYLVKENQDSSDGTNFVASSAIQSSLTLQCTGSHVLNNSTDEEKLQHLLSRGDFKDSLGNRPLFTTVLSSLECTSTDHAAFYALCLLYAIGHNHGISDSLREPLFSSPSVCSLESEEFSSSHVVARHLLNIILLSSQKDNFIRIVTLELTSLTLYELFFSKADISHSHLQLIRDALSSVTENLKPLFKTEDLFLDIFEDDYVDFTKRKLNVSYLSGDASLMFPPLSTPLSGLELTKRLPCGAQENTRKLIRTYFILRDLWLKLAKEQETKLPLTAANDCVKISDCLNLNNSDILACSVHVGENKLKRFLVTDGLQLILVEPDNKKLGWGVVRFVGFLQALEVTGNKEDSRALHLVVHHPSGRTKQHAQPLLTAKFVFDDHIRCMAAKQRLTKGRQKARQYKMDLIASILEIRSAPLSQPQTFSKQVLCHSRARVAPGYVATDVQEIPGKLQPKLADFCQDHISLAKKTSDSKKQHSQVSEDTYASIPLEDLTLGRSVSSTNACSGIYNTSSQSQHDDVQQFSVVHNRTRSPSPRRCASLSPKAIRICDTTTAINGVLSKSSFVNEHPLLVLEDEVPCSRSDSVFTASSQNNVDSHNSSTTVVPHCDEVGLEAEEINSDLKDQCVATDEHRQSSLQCFASRPREKKYSIQNL